jgi:predicted methyltransferase
MYNSHMQSVTQKISEKTRSFSTAEVEGITRILLDNPGIKNNKLVQMTGLPRETLKEFKTSAAFMLKETSEDAIYIRDEFLDILNEENPQAYLWSIIEDLQTPPWFDDVQSQITELRGQYTLTPERDLDQFFATPESTARKTLLLAHRGLITGANIALLGDDDWISVALGLCPFKPATVTVLDIDEHLLETLKNINAQTGNTAVQYITYDVRKKLPKKNFNCDVVVTDPPYTPTGITIFLNRAIELLEPSKDKQKYIFLYFGSSPKTPEKSFKIQEIINRMGLVIEDKIDRAIRYEGAESMGSASSLYILKTTSFTQPISIESVDLALYTYQNLKEEKFPFVDHVVAKITGVSPAMINSKSAIRQALGELCNQHKLKVVDEKNTKFKSQGMTITLVLANSNLVVHTWPEHGALHMDLITCSPIYGLEDLSKNLQRLFAAKSVELRKVE